jgi:hypothetical protein
MGWFRDHRLAVSLGALLVFGGMLALVLGYVGLVVSSAFWSVGGPSVVNVLSELALPFLPIIAFLLVTTVVSGVSAVWTVLGRLSLPRSERLQSTAERIEQSNSTLNRLGLSDFVAPPERTDEEKVETLKQQYVEGEIDEEEFEREIERLNTTEPTDNTHTSHVRGSQETNREW